MKIIVNPSPVENTSTIILRWMILKPNMCTNVIKIVRHVLTVTNATLAKAMEREVPIMVS